MSSPYLGFVLRPIWGYQMCCLVCGGVLNNWYDVAPREFLELKTECGRLIAEHVCDPHRSGATAGGS